MPLFETETEITEKELKRAVGNTSGRGLFMMMLIVVLAFVIPLSLLGFYIAALVIIALSVLAVYLAASSGIKKGYEQFKKNFGTYQRLVFYEDKLEVRTGRENVKFKYEELKKISETRTNFYIQPENYRLLIVIKANCKPELIEFLRSKKGI